MKLELKCPSCGHNRWDKETDHAHCVRCGWVVRFDEMESLITKGKTPIDIELDEVFKKTLP
jgi:hypothetical protein